MRTEILDVLRMLGCVGYELHSSQLIGYPPPVTQRRLKRMANPVAGDIVMETSTAECWFPESPVPLLDKTMSSIGVLLRQEREPVPEWDEAEEGEPAPLERVWYIKALDDSEHRWTNADFVTIIPREGWSAALHQE